jgi:hypothetical protein
MLLLIDGGYFEERGDLVKHLDLGVVQDEF